MESSIKQPLPTPRTRRNKTEEVLESGLTYFLQFYLQEGLDASKLGLWMDIHNCKRNHRLAERVQGLHKIHQKYFSDLAPNYVKLPAELDSDTLRLNPDALLSEVDKIEKWLTEYLSNTTFPKFYHHKLYQTYQSMGKINLSEFKEMNL